jgi:hypothetical protein
MSSQFKLLSREDFTSNVFARDGGKCVVCGQPPTAAHHIVERKLFADGGYYLENGASLCDEHHIAAERTLISVEEVRRLAGIHTPVNPPGVYEGDVIDKWQNYILPNGTRLRGPMFYEEQVQKVLSEAGLLETFSFKVKYPQTKHLPSSPGVGKDDDIISDLSDLVGHECVILEKMDGENWTMYRGEKNCHARSLDGRDHVSRSWAKQFHSMIQADIPEGWRVVTENMYAQHSIRYDDLPSYLYGLSVWDEKNTSLNYDNTLEWFELLGIVPAPEIWRGVFSMEIAEKIASQLDLDRQEGFVVRRVDEIPYAKFRKMCGKFVRPNHVQTDDHWMTAAVVSNGLRKL